MQEAETQEKQALEHQKAGIPPKNQSETQPDTRIITEIMAENAISRIQEFINRSAGQHLRAMKSQS